MFSHFLKSAVTVPNTQTLASTLAAQNNNTASSPSSSQMHQPQPPPQPVSSDTTKQYDPPPTTTNSFMDNSNGGIGLLEQMGQQPQSSQSINITQSHVPTSMYQGKY